MWRSIPDGPGSVEGDRENGEKLFSEIRKMLEDGAY